ncbi:MAG: DUF4412 domain-containing protein [Candidatus Omnitrophica bacterium]|nr:DUF4412 domain-containing protein [Candidatus Omnitrophota bacterium]MDD5238807.1 DUF4412 domain-containing protein [Candidatus Omnitrophota bacterium]
MKNTRIIKLRFLLLLISFFFSGNIAVASDFSADMISNTKEGTIQGKVFFTKGKMRMDTAGISTITRLDKNTVWMLMSNDNKYMELPLQPNNIVIGKDKVTGEIERQLLGKETIDGKITDKYRIVYELGNSRQTILTWVITDLDIPIKTVAEDGSWSVEYKDIMVGTQPASLFEIPSGYQKVDMSSLPAAGNLPDGAGQIDLNSLGVQ